MKPKIVNRRKEMERVAESFLSKMQCSYNQCSVPGDPSEDTHVQLDWRQDPIRNLSDWTVIIRDGKGSKKYHVHKLQLAGWERRSEYFAKLFGAEEANGNMSDIYLPDPAAEAFPLMLDYFYDIGTLDINTKNAVAIRYLSNYFDVRDLYTKVASFVESDLTIKTAPAYILAAEAVMDKELATIATTICAESFGQMSMEKLVKVKPKVVKEILSSPHINIESETLSLRIAQYTRIRQADITDEILFALTHPKTMPQIAPTEAVYFLSLGLQYPRVLNEGGDSSLKNRCISACSSSWATLAQDLTPVIPKMKGKRKSKRMQSIGDEALRFKSLPEELQVEILQSALISAKADVDNGTEGSVVCSTVEDKDQQLSDELFLFNAVSSSAPKIAVFGSGIPSLNGIFVCVGSQTYEKDAYWKGKPVTFLLHRSSKRGQYRISLKDGHPLITLYSSPISGENKKVPEVGWQREESGIDPPPAFVSTLC